MCKIDGSRNFRIEENIFTELFTQKILDNQGLKQYSGAFTK